MVLFEVLQETTFGVSRSEGFFEWLEEERGLSSSTCLRCVPKTPSVVLQRFFSGGSWKCAHVKTLSPPDPVVLKEKLRFPKILRVEIKTSQVQRRKRS